VSSSDAPRAPGATLSADPEPAFGAHEVPGSPQLSMLPIAESTPRLPLTPSQTIGPFWHALAEPELADLARFSPPGPRLVLTGVVTDGAGAPVADACLELWQPPATDEFPAWGRAATDALGRFRFTTLPTAALAVIVMARGLLKPLWTRVHFVALGDATGVAPGEALDDALLASLPAERRATLLARPLGDGVWEWDVRLQGEGETVFLDF
jgi:protocatechuate 3,4-dioxygenase, alpha subunit